VLLCHLPSAARPRGNAYQASLESRNPLVPVPLRPPSPPAPRGGRGPGRGAQGPFANQKNRRAQNDLGRRPSTPQKRGAVDQGHSAATERTQALDDEPRRPARTRCSAAWLRRGAGVPLFYHRFSSRPTQVPRRWHRPAAQPASAADQLSARTSWTSSFVLFFPSSTSRRAGRPVGSTPLRVRTVFFEAVMFPLHLISPSRVSFPLSPSAHKEFAVDIALLRFRLPGMEPTCTTDKKN